MLQETLIRLATERNDPCVTISLNTHRTHPDSAADAIVIKNLCHEASERLIAQYGKRPVATILEHLDQLPKEIDVHYNLDSLHIFLSNDTREVIKSNWPTPENRVQVNDHFAVAPLIKAYNRSQEYMILHLSQSGVYLYDALNDSITAEIRNADFPFAANTYYITHHDKGSDPKQVDNMLKEFLNQVDKAVVAVHHLNQLRTVVICTADNYTKLLEVADKPDIYEGHAAINYNHTSRHQLAEQAWEVVKAAEAGRKHDALGELKAAVPRGQVITDLQEIYRAAREGRGDLLFVHHDFQQPVRVTENNTIELATDSTQPGVVDDITSQIAWEVISKKGRAHFTAMEDLAELGPIALKTRY